MNVEITVKGELARATINIETFISSMNKEFSITKAIDESLTIISNKGFGEAQLKELIFSETNWNIIFLRLEQIMPTEIFFSIREVDIKNLPQVVTGRQSGDKIILPIKSYCKDKDVMIIDSITMSNPNSLWSFVENRTVNFNDGEWVEENNNFK